jgi:hypothetical protein
MEIYSTEEFKGQIEQLRRKNAYRGIDEDIIKYFFGKTAEELKSGRRLNLSDTAPYIKTRINGSGGYRAYYLLLIKDDKLYLMFIHPKSGPLAASNMTTEGKAEIYKDILRDIKTKNLYDVSHNAKKDELIFTKTK